MNPEITVIIPFFQKEKGILLRSITSVLNQNIESNILLLVVDDGSPKSAEEELSDLKLPDHITCEIHKQSNSGPASARNFGMKISHCKRSKYIAFLDSDDEWEADHLKRALICLDKGYDFYFSNYIQLGATDSVFERAKFDAKSCKVLSQANKLYEFSGDMFDQVLFNCLIGTPTVVFNAEKLKGIYFNEAFTSAREDTLFWLEVAAKNSTFCFSDNIELICGSGVNVWARSEWGSLKCIDQLLHYIKYSLFVRKTYKLTEHQARFIKGEIKKNRYKLIECILHRVIKRKVIPVSLSKKIIKLDVAGILLSPFIVAKLVLLKFTQ